MCLSVCFGALERQMINNTAITFFLIYFLISLPLFFSLVSLDLKSLRYLFIMPKPSARCLKRLQAEFKALQTEGSPNFCAAPNPNDILKWYFVLDGSPDTPYEGGRYLGELRFDPDFPMKAPDFLLLTPNGRFSVGTPVCLSISSYHNELWNPLWSVKNMMSALIFFMNEDQVGIGAQFLSSDERKQLAKISRMYNIENLSAIYRLALREEYEKDLCISSAKVPCVLHGTEISKKNSCGTLKKNVLRPNSVGSTFSAIVVLLLALLVLYLL